MDKTYAHIQIREDSPLFFMFKFKMEHAEYLGGYTHTRIWHDFCNIYKSKHRNGGIEYVTT